MSKTAYLFFATTSDFRLSISIAFHCASAITCTSMACCTSTCISVDIYSSASTTFSYLKCFYAICASTKYCSTTLSSFDFSSSPNPELQHFLLPPKCCELRNVPQLLFLSLFSPSDLQLNPSRSLGVCHNAFHNHSKIHVVLIFFLSSTHIYCHVSFLRKNTTQHNTTSLVECNLP